MIILKNNESLHNKIISAFAEDAIRLNGKNGFIDRVSIIDTANSDAAHRDAIQIIPPSETLPNQQFAGAVTNFVNINACTIFSTGQLQGIFCSDGLIKSALITDNQIQTASQHAITINGLLSGLITRNVDEHGNPVRVVLNNLRIGGGVANIWIKSFKDHYYEDVIGEDIIDNRGLEHHKNGVYIDNFDLDLFVNRSAALEYVDTTSFCENLGELAFDCAA